MQRELLANIGIVDDKRGGGTLSLFIIYAVFEILIPFV